MVKVIPAKIANEFVKKHHYSGKVDPRCYVHFGCFLDDRLHGVMQLGPSINKHASVNLVKNTHWNGYCELARMAFDDYLPANSESRCISIMMKLLKKQAPHIEWVVSYADGAQCGDGSIYRASGFYLVDIKKIRQCGRCLMAKWCAVLFLIQVFPQIAKTTKARSSEKRERCQHGLQQGF